MFSVSICGKEYNGYTYSKQTNKGDSCFLNLLLLAFSATIVDFLLK